VEDAAELVLEGRVVPGLLVRGGELLDGEHERLGHVPAAVRAEPPAGVGEGLRGGHRHESAHRV
jgi:hypothetical protein